MYRGVVRYLAIALFFGYLFLATEESYCQAGTVKVDGSSTVYPIAEAVAEEFLSRAQGTRVTVGISGTGGGFKKFIAGEIDVVNASRPIKQSEIELAVANGISFVELPVAFDALSIVVNVKNTWLNKVTVNDLKIMWEPAAQGAVLQWNQIRPEWPARAFQLYGAGVDSGTFDYFTEAIVGKEDASRGDFTSSEDDNIIVKGVEGNENAIGFLGMSYYEANKDKLRAVPVDDEQDSNGVGAQLPTAENVLKGTYKPLSRPLYIYVRRDALDRPEVQRFVVFYLEQAAVLAPEVGYVALPEGVNKRAMQRLHKKVPGSVYGGHGNRDGASLESLMAVAE
jgi:phosphate transport system substrate-binding protein